ncbi:hypothetical protein CMT48_17040 [Elizabethkingia anophelis]|uniref:hypothetical protein n=1 Tax=Elizabethkingia TaxID=308865 RepID=UPI0020B6A37A|nr:hypothetical protein [Elizabethkingia anophelis]MCT4024346.1 hypothetical protein [Elizabethkingia anophelis]MDV3982776.1 hypothetical protein [Elizabethkingia anophelis]UTG62458.1 hypothetical protein J2O09_05740 [Elizabethkingia anophelis]UXM68742.1 hypothetical protein N7E57_05755 [Elizabethkingia anophelis]
MNGIKKFDLIHRMHYNNEKFYSIGLISQDEYLDNNVILISELRSFSLNKIQIKVLKEAVTDEFSLIKFRVGIQTLLNYAKN